MFSLIFFVAGLSLLIVVHEWGHFIAARFFNMLVEEFGIGFPPRMLSKKIGETLWSVNAIPLGGFVRIFGENQIDALSDRSGRSFASALPWKRAVVVSAGVVMNFIAGWLLFTGVFLVGSPPVIMIENVAQESSAAQGGIEKGDIILDFENAETFTSFVREKAGQQISIRVKRGSDTMSVAVTPRLNSPVGEGALGIVVNEAGIPQLGLFESVGRGLVTSLSVTVAIIGGLYQAFFNPENILGPLGIFDAALETGGMGFVYLLQFLALISLNLVVLNSLPIPALDGGRLLFIIIEKIRGKKMSSETEQKANIIGFSLLILLMGVVTIKDIIGLF